MKKLLIFILPLFFLINVNAQTITQYSHGYDEFIDQCSNDSFYYILEDSLGHQGFGEFAHTYDAHFAKLRADINYQLVPNTTYEITFSNPIHSYNTGPDQYGWTAITPSSVEINIENGCGGAVMRPVQVLSVDYPNSNAYDRDLVVITFKTSDYVAKPWFSITLQSGYTDLGIYQITTGYKARLDNIYLNIVNGGGDSGSGGDTSGDASNQDIINNNQQNTNNIINNQNENTQEIIDAIDDGSDPNISDSELSSFFSSFSYTDPLAYLLTLPVQLINKIVSLSDNCSTINLGTLYGFTFTLPCLNLETYLGSAVWGTIDVIMSVTLLVIILKNFYDTISNLLTLGGEKEAKEKFSMPTPMDFLARILGGDA